MRELKLTLLHWLSMAVCWIALGNAACAFGERDRFIKEPNDYTYIPPKTFSFESFQKVLADPKVTGVDSLIENLPEQYHENYVEIFASRSKEKKSASAKTPRIVTYGDEGKLIIAYTGDPAHPDDFNKIQILRFNDQGPHSEWELYESSVPPKKDASGKMLPLEKNPSRCLGCHGNPPKPIWDSYFLWPGVFGSDDEDVFRVTKGGADRAPVESALRKFFLDNKPSLPRYAVLKEHEGQRTRRGNRLQPYSMDEPNTTFGQLLTLHHTKAIASALNQSPRAMAYRFALLGALTCNYSYWSQAKQKEETFSYPMSQFLPEGYPGGMDISEANLLKQIGEMDKLSFELRLKRQREILKIDKPEGRAGEEGDYTLLSDERRRLLARLMYVLEGTGFNLKDWSMDRDKLLAINDGSGTFLENLEREFWNHWINQSESPELFELFSKSGKSSSYPYSTVIYFGGSEMTGKPGEVERELAARKKVCDLLVTASRKALAQKADRESKKQPPANTNTHGGEGKRR